MIVPLDRETAGGFWDAGDGGGGEPASPLGTPPGIGGVGPAWPYSSAASPSCDPASSVATAPKGSWVGLKASMVALGSPAAAGRPVFRFTLSILIPGGARNGIGGWSARAILKKSRTTGAETLPPVSPCPMGDGLAVAAAAGFMLWKVSKDLPDYEVLAKYEPPVMTRIHANDGNLIAEFARERRIYVPFKAIPDRLVEAFLSAEEARHYVEQWEETVEMRTNFTVRPVTPLQSSFGRVSRHLRKNPGRA